MKVSISKDIKLDVMRLVESKLLLQGSSGSGKSMTLRTILEKTFGLVPHIIIDIEGEFGTLREKYDYILAGKGGDIPVDVRSAQLLARKMLELNASIIIDISELKPLDRHRYVKLFLEALIEAPKELWGPRLIVIDEAHTFCPEKSSGSSEASESVIDLCSRGRKRGLGAILATQRLSKLNKDAAAECSNKIMGLANMDIDRERSAKELGFTHREDILALRDLEPGEFFCVGPALCRTVTKTQISIAETSHPKIGKRAIKKPTATKKVLHLLEKIKDLPKEAEQELKTTADLKMEIQRLKQELRNVPQPKTVVEKVVEKVNVEKIRREIAVAYRVSTKKWADDFVKEISEFSGKLGTRPEWAPPEIDMSVSQAIQLIQPTIKPFKVHTKPFPGMIGVLSDDKPSGEFRPSKNQRLILNNLCLFPDKVFKVSQIALMCGVSNNGHFSNELTALAQQGLIVRDHGQVQISGKVQAIRLLGNDFRPRDKNIVEFWRDKLNPQRRAIFEFLLRSPDSFSLGQVAEAVGKSNNGHFSNECTALHTLGLITRNHGIIRLHPDVLMES